MKRLALTVAVLASCLAALTPARADYAVVRFADGYCQVWWDAGAVPWGTAWSKIAITPDWSAAQAAMGAAIRDGVCD